MLLQRKIYFKLYDISTNDSVKYLFELIKLGILVFIMTVQIQFNSDSNSVTVLNHFYAAS